MTHAGSYIFSQTLFGSRMGVDSRLMGCILTGAWQQQCNSRVEIAMLASHCMRGSLWHVHVHMPLSVRRFAAAVAELAVFMVPFNVMTFLPSFYFGGVIAWIGQDILKARSRGQSACLWFACHALLPHRHM